MQVIAGLGPESLLVEGHDGDTLVDKGEAKRLANCDPLLDMELSVRPNRLLERREALSLQAPLQSALGSGGWGTRLTSLNPRATW